LKAIFPLAVTADLYEGAVHHGLLSSGFVTPFLSMIGLTSDRSDEFWRSLPVQLARKVLHAPPLHRKFATMNGEASLVVMRQLLKLPHDPHPWDQLWLNAAVKHRKARQQGERSVRLRIPKPLHISNVKLIDPSTNEPTRVGRRVEDGKLVRYAKKSNKTIAEPDYKF